ncbi:MAG: hypothetical protein VYE22_37660 [Myxococcota bacterium]|nr:hypothetical protein [Myxococcota bacterium]
MKRFLMILQALGLMAVLSACGSAGASVDDDPGTEDGDVEASAGGDITEGEAAIDVDVGDDDDPDDMGEEGESDDDPVDEY